MESVIRRYYDGLGNGVLHANRCSSCGKLTFPPTTCCEHCGSWQVEDTDSYWGPAVHWNTYLESWVMLLNRSCCTAGFPQEGIYAAFNPDLANPNAWSRPRRIPRNAGWYPQIMGTGPGESDHHS